VENAEDGGLARVGKPVVHKRNEVSTVQRVSSVNPATGMPADLPFFRCSVCPVQVRFSEGTWLSTVASGRWWPPSLPSRSPSEARFRNLSLFVVFLVLAIAAPPGRASGQRRMAAFG
jgi:hypothetical protein